jgi:hypothetical protein
MVETRITIYPTHKLKTRIMKASKHEEKSMNDFLIKLIEKYLEDFIEFNKNVNIK